MTMAELHLIAHDIRSRENIGALFRVCDSLGVKKLWLTGYTPAPPDAKISKVALGAEGSVVFEKVLDVTGVMKQFKKDGISIFALEQTPEAQELSQFKAPPCLAILLGSERGGVSPSLLSMCDGAIQINQRGMKESLNVTIAAAIAAWAILT
ncbi:TrmH family RNA methyltransferase [Candidatus Uhrbacteria bacterium]|nr:TrmH family RNA methyltransferase [Candidatus Uhrbacteria bacterium]